MEDFHNYTIIIIIIATMLQ